MVAVAVPLLNNDLPKYRRRMELRIKHHAPDVEALFQILISVLQQAQKNGECTLMANVYKGKPVSKVFVTVPKKKNSPEKRWHLSYGHPGIQIKEKDRHGPVVHCIDDQTPIKKVLKIVASLF